MDAYERRSGLLLSNDREFESKLIDVVGLYLSLPEHAMVFSVDEKSQIQVSSILIAQGC